MKLIKTFLFCGYACSLVMVVTGCQEEIQTTEAPRPVRAVIAKAVSIGDEVAQTGEIQANVETNLGFRIDGRVATRIAEIGMSVVKGQVLATLDPSDVQNEVLTAEAEVKSAEAVEGLAKSELDRQRTLFAKQFVARARVEEAEANWRASNAKLNVARTGLQTARNKLTYTELRAPDDAIVSAVLVNAGQVVDVGQPAIKLSSTHERDAVFNVSERIYTSVPSDVQVEVALLSDPSVKVIGRLRDASPTADPATRTYRVRIALPDAPDTMALGATVTGRLILPGKSLIILPSSALTSEAGNPAVFVVHPARQELVRKPVVVARYTATQALVESGLSEGDAVVTAGVSKLRHGQKVTYDAREVAK
ncbi:efflux RND transporter periplasmic adaptor subunit [Pseudomonas sp. HMWF032]|uniref:efflux RND transporter periplasmic adaptor subunit n=1 Tax=unclassified Pseudomonas TaxID=196821 RepID=UPI000D356B37|nr:MULTISPECIES: efflux RND transporter periplasmic adaptor subunit [unclassified Pseudomonas]PTS84258.1 efflux RND transporter periplasmic adaptor subunit [Pseudomonas sp. HMWF032]PTT82537.1 efflux RND transporter periplasmic adaptor subunit [Pseudomonas sp. HMWF010]WAC44246.1 efflux RND transporter periplasmic adaptor subunit [Pseudomonas sp. SL4(2022)]